MVAWSWSGAEPPITKMLWRPSESFLLSPPTGPVQGCLPLLWNILSPDIPSISTTLGLGNPLAQSTLSNTLSGWPSLPGTHVSHTPPAMPSSAAHGCILAPMSGAAQFPAASVISSITICGETWQSLDLKCVE